MLCSSGSMRPRIVLLKEAAVLPDKWMHNWIEYLFLVCLPIDRSIQNDKLVSHSGCHPCPNKYTSTTPSVVLLDTAISKTFASPPSNTQPSIRHVDTKLGLVHKKNISPLGSSPVQMSSAPQETLLTVSRCELRATASSHCPCMSESAKTINNKHLQTCLVLRNIS